MAGWPEQERIALLLAKMVMDGIRSLAQCQAGGGHRREAGCFRNISAGRGSRMAAGRLLFIHSAMGGRERYRVSWHKKRHLPQNFCGDIQGKLAGYDCITIC